MSEFFASICHPLWFVEGEHQTPEEAFASAEDRVPSLSDGSTERLEVVGDFVLPPSGGPPSRDFQTLHHDFGLPLEPRFAGDVALYTALYVGPASGDVGAITRLVCLDSLLRQRDWPPRCELARRFSAYGRTHGAWDDNAGYWEGSLARIIDAAAMGPMLPSVKADPDFLCGMEFDSAQAELAFFARHGLNVDEVAVDIQIRPGQLLVFDNLAFAHGRLGVRQPGGLHQRMFGHRQLSPLDQLAVREKVLSAFGGGSDARSAQPAASAAVSRPLG